MPKTEENPDNACGLPESEIRNKLSPLQYSVARTGATERPFDNEYWNNHAAGVYLDIVDGTPLFSSEAKFDSGTGWPSFWEPLDRSRLDLIEDRSLGMRRIEVRSASSGSHLGHLFDDGPEPTRQRYCMNSASMRFVPLEKLEDEGLGELKKLFG